MELQQEPDYNIRVIADLEFATMACVQGNMLMAERAYREALKDLIHIKGIVEPKKFERYKQAALSGLEVVYRFVLKENAGVSYLGSEKLLQQDENPHAKKYHESMREVLEEARILEDMLSLHNTPC